MEEASTVGPTLTLRPGWERNDVLLQQLVDLVNGTEKSVPIVLFVSGVLVSGKLVSGHKWFGESDPNGQADVEEFFDRNRKLYTERAANAPLPTYIHIDDVMILSGGVPISAKGPGLWRGQIAEVDGFLLGSINRDNASVGGQ